MRGYFGEMVGLRGSIMEEGRSRIMVDSEVNDWESLDELYKGALETLISQAHNIGASLDFQGLNSSVVSDFYRDEVHRLILVIVEDNIKSRLDSEGDATWRWKEDPEVPRRNLDAVVVFYGPANSPGAIWHESAGCKYKDNYRRCSWMSKICPHPTLPDTWREIPTLLTEKNLEFLLKGFPLEVSYMNRRETGRSGR